MNIGSRLLTLVFTDLVDSTRLKREQGDLHAGELIARHRVQVERFLGQCRGRVIDWAGDGCFATFEIPSEAVLFALRLQQTHASENDLPKVRIGIHLGEVTESQTPGGTLRIEGLAVDVAARIQGLAMPGQVLLSSSAFNSARQRLRGEELGAPVAWRAHGPYQLKGVEDPLEIAEAGLEGLSPLAAPEDSDKAHRLDSELEESTLGWRPAVGLVIPHRENWTLVEQLGEGGFGEVWRADHAKTKESRVFKFCFQVSRVRALRREVVLFRLLKESLGARDDIARVVDWQFNEAPYFLESEYTRGGDLQGWAEARGGIGQVALPVRLALVAQAAEALGAAHSVGVLHKDIKPRNILVSEDAQGQPRARLTDFGIGAIVDPSALYNRGITAEGLTQTLAAASNSSGTGTRLFMAPELVEGKPPTTLSDIYALGVLLYQAVIGDFQHSVAPGWERDIEDDLLREDIAGCIDGEPSRRIQSAFELAERLRTLEARREKRKRERQAAIDLQRAWKRRRLFIVASTVGSILTLIAAGIAFRENGLRTLAESARLEALAAQEIAEAAQKDTEAASERERLAHEEAESARQDAVEGEYRANILKAITLLDERGPNAARETLESIPESLRGWEWGLLADRAWPDYARDDQAPPRPLRQGITVAEMWNHATTSVVYSRALDIERLAIDSGDNINVRGGGKTVVWDPQLKEKVFEIPEAVGAWGWSSSSLSPNKQYAKTTRVEIVAILDGMDGRETGSTVGHKLYVEWTYFTPDSRYLVTVSWDGTVRVWELPACEQRATINLNYSPWNVPIRFSSNGATMMIPWGMWTVKTYSIPEGKELASYTSTEPTGEVIDIAPDMSRVLSRDGGKNTRYTVWEPLSGKIISSIGLRSVLNSDTPFLGSQRFSPDGSCVALWPNDQTIELWDARTGTKLTTFQSAVGFRSFAFFSDGSVGIVEEGRFSRLAPAAVAPSEPNVLSGHHDAVARVVYSHDGRRLLTASYDGVAILWDARTRKQAGSLKGHTGKILEAQFSPDDSTILTIAWDGTSRLWDARDARALHTVPGGWQEHTEIGGAYSIDMLHNSADSNLPRFSQDGKRVIVPLVDREGAIVDVESGAVLFQLEGPDKRGAEGATFTPDGRFAVTSVRTGRTCVWDASSGDLAVIVGDPVEHWTRLSPDGQYILMGFNDFVTLYDLHDGSEIWRVEPGGIVLCAVFIPDGTKIVLGLGHGDGSVRILDATTGTLITRWTAAQDAITAALPRPDGLGISTKSKLGSVCVWDWHGNPRFLMDGNGIPIDLAWSPDSRSLAIARLATMDRSLNSVEIWESIPWEELKEYGGEDAGIGSRIAMWRERPTD